MNDQNRLKLRGRMVEKYGTIQEFAKHASRNNQFISKVLNGKSTLLQTDIEEWVSLLDISSDEIGSYFFGK